jgi:outer membrane protein OmpA-like peptidoglycan-associated protein
VQIEPKSRTDVRGLLTRGLDVRGLELPADTPRLPIHIEFKRDKWSLSDLSGNAERQLQEAAHLVKEWQGQRVAIEGYTCSCGSKDYGKRLARKRAETIRDYFVSKGLLSPGNTIIVAYGEDNPVVDTGDENLPPDECEHSESHSMNRRVVIRPGPGGDPGGNPGSDPGPVKYRPAVKVSFWWRPSAGGQFRRLTNGAVLHTQDQVKVFLLASHPCYAYVLHKGSVGDYECLFPNEAFCKEALARNPLEPERHYWLPGFAEGFHLDNVTGLEETTVYISATPDRALEDLIARLLKGEGSAKEVDQIVAQIPMRGLGEVVASKSEDVSLPLNWYARISFRHEP